MTARLFAHLLLLPTRLVTHSLSSHKTAEGFDFKNATEEFQPVLKAYTAHSSKILRQFCVSASLDYSLCKLTGQAALSVQHELAPEPLYPTAASSTILDTDASWNETSAFDNWGLHDICMLSHLITMRGTFLVLVSTLTSVHHVVTASQEMQIWMQEQKRSRCHRPLGTRSSPHELAREQRKKEIAEPMETVGLNFQ